MRAFWSLGLLAMVLVLGCASNNEGVAQERPEKPAAKKPKDEKKSTKAKDEKDKRKYRAVVKDKHLRAGEKPFTVNDAVLFVPEVTLFGGGAGEEVKELKLKRGSAEVTIPFARIASLEIGKLDEDRLGLTVTLRDVKDPADAKLKGSVKASLELRGKLGSKDLDTVVKLREAKTVELSVVK